MAIQLDVVTPEKRVLSVQAEHVRAPGADGLFGVLPGHTPFLAAMEPGELTYRVGGSDRSIFVGGGFVEVADDKMIVLAEAAEPIEEIDVARAQQALADAQARLAQLKSEEESAAIERARVKRAAARIAVARKR